MQVKFVTIPKNKLGTVPIIDGQIIAVSDKTAVYYDMNSKRRLISGFRVCEELPKTGTDGEVYLLSSETSSGIYVWNETSSTFLKVAGDSSDTHIFVETVEDKAYIVGVPDYLDGTYTGKITESVYIKKEYTEAGEKFVLHVDEIDGSIENAKYAETAGTASKTNKLGDKTVGSETNPIYLDSGEPKPVSHILEKDVPSDAKLTDTTYDVFTSDTDDEDGTDGLVPHPTVYDSDKFLKSSGTWSTIDTMIGCSETDDGVAGIVPTPEAGQVDHILTGEGKWKTISGDDNIKVDGLSLSLKDRQISATTSDQSVEVNGSGYIEVHDIQYNSAGVITSDTVKRYKITSPELESNTGENVLQTYYSYVDDEDVDTSDDSLTYPLIFANYKLLEDGEEVVASVYAADDVIINPVEGSIYANNFYGSVDYAQSAGELGLELLMDLDSIAEYNESLQEDDEYYEE